MNAKIFFFIIPAFFCLIFQTFADDFHLDKVQNRAVWKEADTVIMHIPGEEIFWVEIMPFASGYTSLFNKQDIVSEFHNLIRQLRKFNVKVIQTNKVMLSGTIDSIGNTIQDAPLYQLKDFSQNYLNINTRHLKAPLALDTDKYKKAVISKLSSRDTLRLIFTNPTIELYQELDYTSANNILSPKFIPKPFVNFFYIEDSAITTDKGVVVGKFANPQRHGETDIMKFIFSRLMIEPVYAVTGNGTFEGGDYIPAGDVVFLGQGIRTNPEGIKQLLENKVFSAGTIVVIKDKLKYPMQMHLHSYFNIFRDDLAVLAEDRISDGKKPKADIYKFDSTDNKYVLKQRDIDFINYIKTKLGFKIIPVSHDDIMGYATDFLLIKKNVPLISKDVSRDYKNDLEDNNVKAVYINAANIQAGGGGIKSVIQVLNRKNRDSEGLQNESSGGHL